MYRSIRECKAVDIEVAGRRGLNMAKKARLPTLSWFGIHLVQLLEVGQRKRVFSHCAFMPNRPERQMQWLQSTSPAAAKNA